MQVLQSCIPDPPVQATCSPADGHPRAWHLNRPCTFNVAHWCSGARPNGSMGCTVPHVPLQAKNETSRNQAKSDSLSLSLSFPLYILYYSILPYTRLYTILHDTTLHYTTLHYTTLHYTTLNYTTLHYTILYFTILYYTLLYYTRLDLTILYYT